MMKDFSEVTDLETARKILISYDEAFMKGAAEIERLKAALRVIAEQPYDSALRPNFHIARTALEEKKDD